MKCEHCGHEQASGKFCDACGLAVTRIQVDSPDDAGAHEENEAPESMTCRYCGHVQETRGRFCDGCGMMFDFYRAEPEEEETGYRCRQCARLSTARICPNCGIPVPGFPTEE